MNIPDRINFNTIPADFDWFEVLGELKLGAEISDGEFHTISTMAGNWPTCACGQLCKVLARDEMGRPLDSILTRLGTEFAELVRSQRWPCAIAVFEAIEERTVEILADQCERR